MDAAGARGEGLEPSITGPEPVVLPITPPPNGWTFRLAESPSAPGRRHDQGGGALNPGVPDGMMRRPGSPGGRSGSEVFCMHRWSAAAVTAAGLVGPALLAAPAPAGAAGISVKVTPEPRPRRRADRHRQRPRPPRVGRGQPADLVRHRVHRRRAGPDEPLHRHPALRHHRGPAAARRPQRHLLGPLPGHDRDHRRRLLRHARARHLRPRASGPPRAWAPSCASRSRPRRRPPLPPRPRRHDDELNAELGDAQASCSHSRWL